MRLPVTLSIHRSHLLPRLLCRGDIIGLQLGADGRLGCERRDGTHHEAEIDPRTTIFPTLVVLRLRVGSSSESLVLPRAATGAAAHRQLRVWLRWCAQTGSVSALG